MKILFDTNIILDVLLDRDPFSEIACILMSEVERGHIEGFLCATTITTLFYLMQKAAGRKKAEKAVQQLLEMFEITSVDKLILEKALISDFQDYEDAVIYKSALKAGVQSILSRDIKGFKKAQIHIYTPEELYHRLFSSGNPGT